MSSSRKKKSLLNIITGLFSNILIYILSLFTSRIIKQNLGLEILGLNGVLSNIISILGLTELGLGSIINFALYKPLAEKDEEQISILMGFYKKAYRIIALIVFVIGLFLFPFIPLFIKDSSFSRNYIFFVYSLFLLNSILSYLFSYKATIIAADQKNYILTIISLFTNYFVKISQLLIVLYTSNYLLFLSAQILVTFLYNIVICKIANKLYPYINKTHKKIDRLTYKLIIQKVKALFISSISSIVLNSTDNILISSLCGVIIVGKYTTYLSIVGMISTFINIIFENLRNSVGNFLITESAENKKQLFYRLFYFNQTIVSICSICLFFLLTPFIKLWFGDDVILSTNVIFLITISFYFQKNRLVLDIIRGTAGLFEQYKYMPLFEAMMNLLLSFFLCQHLGLSGVILGTIISYLIAPFWVQPVVVYKNIFNDKIIIYYKEYLKYFLQTCFIFFILFYFNFKYAIINPSNLFIFFFESIILFLFISVIWMLLSLRNINQKYFFKLLLNKLFHREELI